MVRLTGGAKPIDLDPEVSSAAACEQMLEALLADSQSEPFAALSAICGNVLIVHDLELLSERAQQLLLQLIQVRASGSRSSGVRVVASGADNKSEAQNQSPTLEQLQRHLSALRVRMPPLRERREDILPLVRLFLTRHCAELGRAVPAMTPAAARYLMTHEWRGNVRELRDVIVRAVESNHSDLLGVSNLIGESSSSVIPAELSLQQTKTQLIVSFERTFLEHLLQTCHGNINKAARVAQKNRRALFELIRKHEIDVEQYRAVR
jgi:two-component system response regulator GlrR